MRNDARRGTLAAVFAAAAVTFGSGCVTGRPMAFSAEAPAPALDAQQGLALATLKLANVYRTGYQPHVKTVFVRATGEAGETLGFKVDAPVVANAEEADQYEEFFVRLPLPPGNYKLTHVFVTANGALTFGSGTVPVYSPFRVDPGKAVYLGRIEAVRRERKADEPRAGSVIPLIDQAATGFSGGTFDVRVVDRYEKDFAALRAAYAPLASVKVEKALLAPPSAKDTE